MASKQQIWKCAVIIILLTMTYVCIKSPLKFDFPNEHWISIRPPQSTNNSSFGTVIKPVQPALRGSVGSRMNTVPIVADNNILLPMGPRVLRKRANIAFLSADKHLLSSDKQRTLQFPVSL